jgi:hypothetical protein
LSILLSSQGGRGLDFKKSCVAPFTLCLTSLRSVAQTFPTSTPAQTQSSPRCYAPAAGANPNQPKPQRNPASDPDDVIASHPPASPATPKKKSRNVPPQLRPAQRLRPHRRIPLCPLDPVRQRARAPVRPARPQLAPAVPRGRRPAEAHALDAPLPQPQPHAVAVRERRGRAPCAGRVVAVVDDVWGRECRGGVLRGSGDGD